MTDCDEVLDECQRLANYWMNEQSRYDVEIVPTRDEYRLTTTNRAIGVDSTDWHATLDEVEKVLTRFFYARF